MKSQIDSAELLRICNRQKAKCLSRLEQINCPEGYLDIVRSGFGYLRSDLISAAQPNQKHETSMNVRKNDATRVR